MVLCWTVIVIIIGIVDYGIVITFPDTAAKNWVTYTTSKTYVL